MEREISDVLADWWSCDGLPAVVVARRVFRCVPAGARLSMLPSADGFTTERLPGRVVIPRLVRLGFERGFFVPASEAAPESQEDNHCEQYELAISG